MHRLKVGSSSSTVYYATTAGKYYHTKANCSGMKDARKITLATAKAKGKLPCPVCVKTTSNTYVYATTAGKYYHANPTCSGMKDARKVTLAAAKKAGKTACPICIKKNASNDLLLLHGGRQVLPRQVQLLGHEERHQGHAGHRQEARPDALPGLPEEGRPRPRPRARSYVYATTGGKYYHVKANCSGMKNARKVTLASAKASGKTACPVCIKSKTQTHQRHLRVREAERQVLPQEAAAPPPTPTAPRRSR